MQQTQKEKPPPHFADVTIIGNLYLLKTEYDKNHNRYYCANCQLPVVMDFSYQTFEIL